LLVFGTLSPLYSTDKLKSQHSDFFFLQMPV
jgi:hypothetical protein